MVLVFIRGKNIVSLPTRSSFVGQLSRICEIAAEIGKVNNDECLFNRFIKRATYSALAYVRATRSLRKRPRWSLRSDFSNFSYPSASGD